MPFVICGAESWTQTNKMRSDAKLTHTHTHTQKGT